MKYFYFFTILSLLLNVLFSCKKVAPSTNQLSALEEAFKLPEWAKASNIYEVNISTMSEEGNFKGLEKHIPRLMEMGVDLICLRPIQPISLNTKGKSDFLKLPYAVKDFSDINPNFGTAQDFKNLVATLHNSKMRLIIEWMPSHTGWTHKWITDHPDWYIKDETGELMKPVKMKNGKSIRWGGAANLNYDNVELQDTMIDVMQFWLEEYNIDGFKLLGKADITQDFWGRLGPSLIDTKSEVFLLADEHIVSSGNEKNFHASHSAKLYHRLNKIAEGNSCATAIDQWCTEDRKALSKGFYLHASPRSNLKASKQLKSENSYDSYLTLTALSASFDGMYLLPSGMEESLENDRDFNANRHIGFKDLAYAEFYSRLFKLKHENAALWNGVYGGPLVKLVDHEEVFVFKRTKNKDKVIGIFNLSKERQSITLPESLSGRDVLTGQDIIWKQQTALGLEPWQFYLISSN